MIGATIISDGQGYAGFGRGLGYSFGAAVTVKSVQTAIRALGTKIGDAVLKINPDGIVGPATLKAVAKVMGLKSAPTKAWLLTNLAAVQSAAQAKLGTSKAVAATAKSTSSTAAAAPAAKKVAAGACPSLYNAGATTGGACGDRPPCVDPKLAYKGACRSVKVATIQNYMRALGNTWNEPVLKKVTVDGIVGAGTLAGVQKIYPTAKVTMTWFFQNNPEILKTLVMAVQQTGTKVPALPAMFKTALAAEKAATAQAQANPRASTATLAPTADMTPEEASAVQAAAATLAPVQAMQQVEQERVAAVQKSTGITPYTPDQTQVPSLVTSTVPVQQQILPPTPVLAPTTSAVQTRTVVQRVPAAAAVAPAPVPEASSKKTLYYVLAGVGGLVLIGGIFAAVSLAGRGGNTVVYRERGPQPQPA